MAGVVLGDIDLRFVWQAWHLWHWAASGSALGVALGDIYLHFAWQAWRLVTPTFTLRGKHGAGLALVAHLGPSGAAK